ncbi:MAG: hypothetical protein KA052_01290 [Candidatus Pacebacteria bacterium]|nr:hypothetical protein [Candidatus Paceibacterota bacterium]
MNTDQNIREFEPEDKIGGSGSINSQLTLVNAEAIPGKEEKDLPHYRPFETPPRRPKTGWTKSEQLSST